MESERISPKSYTVAVCLSGIFGLIGVQHFYLGRYLLGLGDVALTVGFLVCYLSGDENLIVIGTALLILDIAHTLITTIMLLTGSFRDGKGRLICYPGQRLA
jgi:hypothetical protein